MKKTKILIIISLFLMQWGCTEPFEIETIAFQNVLVVESTITNEMKPQIVKLSRTSTLENSEILFENNADVTVTDSNGNTYNFSQDTETGDYISNQQFQVQPNIEYTLTIVTQDGKIYSSSAEKLTPVVEIGEVYAERIVSQDKDGAQVLVNTEDPTDQAKYFRYEYEETYKIVIPFPTPYFTKIINYNPNPLEYEIEQTLREPLEDICYETAISTGINQTSTADFSNNKVNRFPVRYIEKNNSIIRDRYSILVKQYVQSIEAYTFYKTLKELGSLESLLSQVQPGYVAGNITSGQSANEKVLGFFEVSSMTQKRVYFNYEDVGLEKPPFSAICEQLVLDYRDNTAFDFDPNDRKILYDNITFFNYQIISGTGPIYTIARPQCSLCTSPSTTLKPDFWED